MSATITSTEIDEYPCLELRAGQYHAWLAPELGNKIFRMRQEEKNIEFFHVDETHPYITARENPETYGYPFLYLPNRLDYGVLKTSDATYHLPVNEEGPFYNCLHGFLHKRPYTVVDQQVVDDDTVKVTSRYVYDSSDPLHEIYPVSFTAEMTYILNAHEGLRQEFSMTNDGSAAVPAGFCSHTAFKVPFVDGTDEKDYVLSVPVTERWEITNRCLPTEKRYPLTPYDQRYNEGTIPCAGKKLDNDLYTAGENTLDGKPFYGAIATHTRTGSRICYEVSREYRFWCVWNDGGDHGYFCPEPCTWMINAPNLTLPPEETGYTELAQGETYSCWQHIFAE